MKAEPLHPDADKQEGTCQRLRQALQQWQATFDALAESVWVVDTQYRIQRCNRAAETVFGEPANQMIGKHCCTVAHGQLSHAQCPLRRTQQSRCRGSMELALGDRLYQVTVDPLLSETDEILGVVHVMREVTKHKQAEEELLASRERYRTLLERSPRAIVIARNDRIVSVNPAALRLFGASDPAQLLGTSLFGLIDPEYHAIARDQMQSLPDDGKFVPVIEEKYVRLNGAVVDVEVAAVPFIDHEGGAVQIIIRDITDHNRADQVLRDSQQQFQALFETNPIGLFTVDLECRFTSVNPAAEKISGYSAAELIGTSFTRLCIPEQLEELLARFRAAQRGKTEFGHVTLIRKDGRQVEVRLIGAPIIREDRLAGVYGLAEDVTQQRLAEAERQRHRDELAHAARLATMGEFAASIAHELNQPLAAILNNAEAGELLLDKTPPALEDVRNILADIRKDDLRAAEVISRMRELLQKRSLRPEWLDLGELITEVVRMIGSHATLRDITTRVRFGRQLPKVFGDRIHLQQVIINLAINGMEAMADGPDDQRELLLIVTNEEPGWIKVSVTDCGSGIAPQHLTRLFEPFYTTKVSGMGIGLSIARTIVEAHGGRIWAANNLDRGATVGFSLPFEEQPP